MKVGEILFCKKNMGDDSFLPELLFFKKGEIYRITKVIKLGVYVIRGRSVGFYFTIIRIWAVNGYNYFDEYFIPLKELRKQKLKKINESIY